MTGSFAPVLGEVAAVPGVRAALLAAEHDGVPVASLAAVEVDGDALAAFGTALFRRARLAGGAAGHGTTHQVALDATRGRVLAGACGDFVLVVLAERDAGAGLLRLAMQRAARLLP